MTIVSMDDFRDIQRQAKSCAFKRTPQLTLGIWIKKNPVFTGFFLSLKREFREDHHGLYEFISADLPDSRKGRHIS